MGISIGDVRKRTGFGTFHRERVIKKPGSMATKRAKHGPLSKKAKESMARKFNAIKVARQTKAEKEVLLVYKKGWSNLRPDQRKSIYAIANALIARKEVLTFKSIDGVVKILKGLAIKGKIKLPQKGAKK